MYYVIMEGETLPYKILMRGVCSVKKVVRKVPLEEEEEVELNPETKEEEKHTMSVSVKGRELTQEELDSVFIADVCMNPPKFFKQACQFCCFYAKCNFYGKGDYAGIRRKKLRQPTEEEVVEEPAEPIVEKPWVEEKPKPKRKPQEKKVVEEVMVASVLGFDEGEDAGSFLL